ncbi:hypothetical protein ACFSHQ_10900 [Gemmobacter lanyuensis]
MQDYYANLERLLYDQDGELSRRLKSAALIILSAEELRSCVEQKALLFFGLQKELSWRRDDDPLPIEYEGLRSKNKRTGFGLRASGSKALVHLVKTILSWFGLQ